MGKKLNTQQLPCPLCGEPNPVNKANIRLKCKCGANLISVRIVKKTGGKQNGRKR